MSVVWYLTSGTWPQLLIDLFAKTILSVKTYNKETHLYALIGSNGRSYRHICSIYVVLHYNFNLISSVSYCMILMNFMHWNDFVYRIFGIIWGFRLAWVLYKYMVGCFILYGLCTGSLPNQKPYKMKHSTLYTVYSIPDRVQYETYTYCQ